MPRYLFRALTEITPTLSASAGTLGAKADTAASCTEDRTKDRTDRHRDQSTTPLEKNFPHILEKIQVLWGYPELNQYFLRLTIDERGDREGFPVEVWDELQLLVRIHCELFPDQAP